MSRPRGVAQDAMRHMAQDATNTYLSSCPDASTLEGMTLGGKRRIAHLHSTITELGHEYLRSTHIDNASLQAFLDKSREAIDETKSELEETLNLEKQKALAELGENPSDEDKKKVEDDFKTRQENLDDHFKKIKEANDNYSATLMFALNGFGQSGIRSVSENISATSLEARKNGPVEVVTMNIRQEQLATNDMSRTDKKGLKERLEGQGHQMLSDLKEINVKATFDPKTGVATISPAAYMQLSKESKKRTKQLKALLKGKPSAEDIAAVLADEKNMSGREKYWKWAASKHLGNGARDVTLDKSMSFEKQMEAAKYLMLHSRGEFPMADFFERLDRMEVSEKIDAYTPEQLAMVEEVRAIKRAIVDPAQERKAQRVEKYGEVLEDEQATEFLQDEHEYIQKNTEAAKIRGKFNAAHKDRTELSEVLVKEYGEDGSPQKPFFESLMEGTGGDPTAADVAANDAVVKKVLENHQKRFEVITEMKQQAAELHQAANALLVYARKPGFTKEQAVEACERAEAMLEDAHTKLQEAENELAVLNPAHDAVVRRIDAVGPSVEIQGLVNDSNDARYAAVAPSTALADLDDRKREFETVREERDPSAPAP